VTPVHRARFRHVSGESEPPEGSGLYWESPECWEDWDERCPEGQRGFGAQALGAVGPRRVEAMG